MTLTSGDDNIAAFKKSTITDRTDLTMVTVGEILWEPSPEWVEQTNLNAFRQWLKENRNVEFDDLHQMRRWSLDHLDDFWQAAWDYFDIEASSPPSAVLGKRTMPGAQWFPGSKL